MEHFLQRIRLRTHIKPLKPDEVKHYINHRLKVAGARNVHLFDDTALADIYRFTSGCLRLINTLCDYTLMICFVEKLPRVDSWVVHAAANELQWEPFEQRFAQSADMTQLPGRQAMSKMATITVFNGEAKLSEHSLNKEVINIGRSEDNDIRLETGKISRKHAQIVAQQGKFYLHDLQSTNGTWVNGKKIDVHLLQSGDTIQISQFSLCFTAVPSDNPLETSPLLELVTTGEDATRVYAEREQTRQMVYPHAVDD